MNDYISLSTLNDFIFCPYSIYLHNVYMESDEDCYKATPQTKGTIAHKPVDEKRSSTSRYDISDTKLRTKFSKMLVKHGAIRLQFSVYEVENTKRVIDNIIVKIEAFAKKFTSDDSVVVFNVNDKSLIKYGNAIHRDQLVVYF